MLHFRNQVLSLGETTCMETTCHLGDTSKFTGSSLHTQQPAAANLYRKCYTLLLDAAAFWLQPTVMNFEVFTYLRSIRPQCTQSTCHLFRLQELKATQHAAYWSYGSKYSKLKKTIEIHLVWLTEVCGKVQVRLNGIVTVLCY